MTERKSDEAKNLVAPSAGGATMLPEEPTPEMIASVSTILQPYAAGLVWKRMLQAAKVRVPDSKRVQK